MTRQVDDLFWYQGIQYALCGISEGELFDPWPLMDVAPTLWGASTACWRGYQAVYALADSQLILDELGISLYDMKGENYTRHVGPPINGVSPTKDRKRASSFNNHYVGLGYPLDYTGALLLGDGFIKELYRHSGFHPAWKYTNIIELVFEKGVLTHEFDRSEQMAEIRQQIVAKWSGGDPRRMSPEAELWEFAGSTGDRAYTSEWAPNKGPDQGLPPQRSIGPPKYGWSLPRWLARSQLGKQSVNWLEPWRRLGIGVSGRSVEECETALEAVRAAGDRVAEAAILVDLGNVYLEASDTSRAVDCHQQALAIAREIGDRQIEGVALGSLGNAYVRLSDLQQAKDCDEQALAIARETGDRILEGLHLGNLGTVHRHMGDAWKAIECHKQALLIARETGARELEANQLSNLGTACRQVGRVREAVQHHEEALAHTRELGDRKGEGEVLGCLGNDLLTQRKFEQSARYFEDALDIAREIGDRQNEANWLGGVGNAIFAPVKDWQIGRLRLRDIPQLVRLSRTVRRAMPFFEQAADIAGEVGDRRAEGAWLGNLGTAYHRLGRMRQAIPYYERALTIAQEVGDFINEAGWLRSLGNAHGALKEPERALEYYEQALAVQSDRADPQSTAILLYNMGLRAKQAGDFDRAREIWTRALALCEPIGLPIAARIRQMLAELTD